MKQGTIAMVDLDAITSISHRCAGCAGTHHCCAMHEVCISRKEMRTIAGALPLAARYCPWLKCEDGFDNVFDRSERDAYVIDTHEDGLCVFAYRRNGRTLCSLHSAALRSGIRPHLLKPYACTLWPLMVREPPEAAISICDDALRFPCNRPRKKGNGRISPDILNTIDTMLGSEARRMVVDAARRGKRRVSVPLSGVLSARLR